MSPESSPNCQQYLIIIWNSSNYISSYRKNLHDYAFKPAYLPCSRQTVHCINSTTIKGAVSTPLIKSPFSILKSHETYTQSEICNIMMEAGFEKII